MSEEIEVVLLQMSTRQVTAIKLIRSSVRDYLIPLYLPTQRPGTDRERFHKQARKRYTPVQGVARGSTTVAFGNTKNAILASSSRQFVRFQ
ncbi:hypothetical protein TNCV_3445191 [Trichonephila clavipes]|nr:hypothetical protein TNCV_3445191 [Trichonephila clavipes]